MSVILDIDLDYFALFEHPGRELDRLLAWAARPVDFVVQHHHEAYARWRRMVAAGAIGRPGLIIHADEHHDMMSDRPPANFGSFLYFAMRHWPECRVVWLTRQPIDHPHMWLSEDAWGAVSSRFECARRLSRQWPKPHLVTLCASPGFIDERLSQTLLARISDWRITAKVCESPSAKVRDVARYHKLQAYRPRSCGPRSDAAGPGHEVGEAAAARRPAPPRASANSSS